MDIQFIDTEILFLDSHGKLKEFVVGFLFVCLFFDTRQNRKSIPGAVKDKNI